MNSFDDIINNEVYKYELKISALNKALKEMLLCTNKPDDNVLNQEGKCEFYISDKYALRCSLLCYIIATYDKDDNFNVDEYISYCRELSHVMYCRYPNFINMYTISHAISQAIRTEYRKFIEFESIVSDIVIEVMFTFHNNEKISSIERNNVNKKEEFFIKLREELKEQEILGKAHEGDESALIYIYELYKKRHDKDKLNEFLKKMEDKFSKASILLGQEEYNEFRCSWLAKTRMSHLLEAVRYFNKVPGEGTFEYAMLIQKLSPSEIHSLNILQLSENIDYDFYTFMHKKSHYIYNQLCKSANEGYTKATQEINKYFISKLFSEEKLKDLLSNVNCDGEDLFEIACELRDGYQGIDLVHLCISFLKKSASLGCNDAVIAVGYCCENGFCVEQDAALALQIYINNSELNDNKSKAALRNLIETHVTSDQQKDILIKKYGLTTWTDSESKREKNKWNVHDEILIQKKNKEKESVMSYLKNIFR